MILYSETVEDVLNEASKLDDRIYEAWMRMIGDAEYQKIELKLTEIEKMTIINLILLALFVIMCLIMRP